MKKKYFQTASIALVAILLGLVSPTCNSIAYEGSPTLIKSSWVAELIGPGDSGTGDLTFTAKQIGADIIVEGKMYFNMYFASFGMGMPFTMPFKDISATVEEDGDISFSFEYTFYEMGMVCPMRFTIDGGANSIEDGSDIFILETLDPKIAAMMEGMETLTGKAIYKR